MAVVLKAGAPIVWKYLEASWTYADPRTVDKPLVKNPVGVLSIIALYLCVVRFGPRFMRDRKPFDLKQPMLVYNAVQVLWCAYLFVESLRLGWGWKYSFTCEPLSMTMTPYDFEVADLVYLYYMLKIVDLLDTVFMVLRKNFRQISFLHVYHHGGMVFCIWIGVKVYPGGHHTLLGCINCLVHCVLYAYYFLTLWEPRAKVAWWKKYITLMQITQFGLNCIHEAMPLLVPDCDVNKYISFLLIVQNMFMFTLFTDFYLKNYRGKSSKLPRDKQT